LCQWSTTGGLNTFALALEGPPGIGKTTFAKNVISKVMKRPFNFISLGGATDSSHLVGHSFTYEGAIPGRIIESLRKSKVMNPCFYFDELDKISKTPKGDEVTNVLIHLTDKEQNCTFQDKYFNGIEFDLSQSLFCFSYNKVSEINPILVDRLNIIKFKPPTVEEKIEIAKQHLIPKTLASSAISKDDVLFSDDILTHIIHKYTDESGVRNLEKILSKTINTLSVAIHAPEVTATINISSERPIRWTSDMIDLVVGERSTDKGYMCMYN
jgi:ATP-dependent Lon protease